MSMYKLKEQFRTVILLCKWIASSGKWSRVLMLICPHLIFFSVFLLLLNVVNFLPKSNVSAIEKTSVPVPCLSFSHGPVFKREHGGLLSRIILMHQTISTQLWFPCPSSYDSSHCLPTSCLKCTCASVPDGGRICVVFCGGCVDSRGPR